jgi:hypothetical protein
MTNMHYFYQFSFLIQNNIENNVKAKSIFKFYFYGHFFKNYDHFHFINVKSYI